jgi:hypothetical protein
MTETPQVPQATFMNFLGGLAAQGLMQLGDIPNPMSGTRDRNLPYARYTIQLLEILAQKTTGNRSGEEDTYLNNMIGDLKARLTKAESA